MVKYGAASSSEARKFDKIVSTYQRVIKHPHTTASCSAFIDEMRTNVRTQKNLTSRPTVICQFDEYGVL